MKPFEYLVQVIQSHLQLYLQADDDVRAGLTRQYAVVPTESLFVQIKTTKGIQIGAIWNEIGERRKSSTETQYSIFLETHLTEVCDLSTIPPEAMTTWVRAFQFVHSRLCKNAYARLLKVPEITPETPPPALFEDVNALKKAFKDASPSSRLIAYAFAASNPTFAVECSSELDEQMQVESDVLLLTACKRAMSSTTT